MKSSLRLFTPTFGLFGYTIGEWCVTQPFLDNFVAEEDRGAFSWNYHNRVAALAFPVTLRFCGLRKDGSNFSAETDMIPISHRGHAVAYHFACGRSRSREGV